MYLLNNSFIECVVRSLDLFSCASISHLAVVLLSFFIRRKKTLSINIGIRPSINRLLELIYKLQVALGLPRIHWDSFEYHQWLVTLKPDTCVKARYLLQAIRLLKYHGFTGTLLSTISGWSP